MRITGGEFLGRSITVPKGIRPTQDRVREALFSSLGERVVGARVLDLYAGSGALGLEAWSRGAAGVCWVEADKHVFRILKQNVTALCGAQASARCVLMDANRFLKNALEKDPFDLILADPPYDREGQDQRLEKTLLALEDRPMLTTDGVLVYEQGADEELVRRSGWELAREKKYGDTRLVMYVRG